jgi:hypothetical protein
MDLLFKFRQRIIGPKSAVIRLFEKVMGCFESSYSETSQLYCFTCVPTCILLSKKVEEEA